MLIHTENLRLLTCELDHLEAIVRGPRALGELLNLSVPEGWPRVPEAYPGWLELLRREPTRAMGGWWLYLFIHPQERALIGCGGFRSPPREGSVELGYDVAPAFQGRGFEAEAVGGLIRYAFTRPEVSAVEALSMARRGPQTTVLEQAGMSRHGTETDPQAGPLWRWRITREAFVRAARRKAA